MINALTKLEFNGLPVRVEVIKDEPWFVAADITSILNISNASDAVARLDEDEKLTSVIPISGQNRKTLLVNESGMYNLVFRSVKPEAQQFRKWVTSEVLPQLRRFGRYETTSSLSVTPRNALQAAKQLLLVAEEHENRLHTVEERIEELEHRPALGAPPEGVLFPKFRPEHMTISNYTREMNIELTRNQRCGIGHRIARYCRKVGIFYQRSTHGTRYPIPVLQEFFRE